MKLLKVGELWYGSYEGKLRRSSVLFEDVGKWEPVSALSPEEVSALKDDFRLEIENLLITEKSKPYVQQIELEDPMGPCKFDTWHAVAAAQK